MTIAVLNRHLRAFLYVSKSWEHSNTSPSMAGKSRQELKRSERSESADSGGSETYVTKKPRIDLYVELRILLPNRVAGAIIGRGGVNIKRLRQRFLANVNLPSCTGPERILTITAELSVTCKILTEVIATISNDVNGFYLEDSELRILLNSRQAGAVIGKRGETVKKLRERTGCIVRVFDECCPDSTDQVIQMRGTERAIIRCVQSILRAIERTPPSRIRSYYDPNNFDPISAPKYGGYDYNEAPSSVRNRDRRKRSDSDSLCEVHKSDSVSQLLMTGDDARGLPDKKLVSSTIIPSLLSINVTASTGFASNNYHKRRMLSRFLFHHLDENKSYSEHPVNPFCSGRVPFQPTYAAFRVPSLLSVSPMPEVKTNGLKQLALPCEEMMAHRNFRNGRMTKSPSVTTTKHCLDQLVTTLSCLVATSLSNASSEIRKSPISSRNLAISKLFNFHGSITPQKMINGDHRNATPVLTSQVKIPQKLVGAVFGKGRRRIKSFEAMTSTKIWRDDVIHESSDCVINITGSSAQLRRALELIQSVIKKYSSQRMER